MIWFIITKRRREIFKTYLFSPTSNCVVECRWELVVGSQAAELSSLLIASTALSWASWHNDISLHMVPILYNVQQGRNKYLKMSASTWYSDHSQTDDCKSIHGKPRLSSFFYPCICRSRSHRLPSHMIHNLKTKIQHISFQELTSQLGDWGGQTTHPSSNSKSCG